MPATRGQPYCPSTRCNRGQRGAQFSVASSSGCDAMPGAIRSAMRLSAVGPREKGPPCPHRLMRPP